MCSPAAAVHKLHGRVCVFEQLNKNNLVMHRCASESDSVPAAVAAAVQALA